MRTKWKLSRRSAAPGAEGEHLVFHSEQRFYVLLMLE